MTATDLLLSILYTLTVDRFIRRSADGGGGRGKCPMPCKTGGKIVREGKLSEEYFQEKCPDPPIRCVDACCFTHCRHFVSTYVVAFRSSHTVAADHLFTVSGTLSYS